MRGAPSEVELAALTLVLAGLTAPAQPGAARSTWADPALGLRTRHHPGLDAWRISAYPH